MADAYDDKFDFEDDKDEPLDLAHVIDSLDTKTDRAAPFTVPRFDGVTPHFPVRALLLEDPIVASGELLPNSLRDIDLKTEFGQRVLGIYFPNGVPADIVVLSLQAVQNERVRTNFGNVQNKANYAFHGTPLANVEGIVKDGFKSGIGLLGKGVYVARHFQKANSYALDDLGPDGQLQDKGNERAMFLCHIKLGTVVSQGDGVSATDLRHEKTEDGKLVNSLTRTYKGQQEFMLYDGNRVRPVYLLRYMQLRAVMMTEDEKTLATLRAKLISETKSLGMRSNRSAIIRSAVLFLMSIQDLDTRNEMYRVFHTFIMKPKLFLVINKVDTLIKAGKLQAVHKTALNEQTWQAYMSYRNMMDSLEDQPGGLERFVGRNKFFELLRELSIIAAKNAHCTPDQQRRLRTIFTNVLSLNMGPEEALQAYNRSDAYVPNLLLYNTASDSAYNLMCAYRGDQEVYKRGLVKKSYQA